MNSLQHTCSVHASSSQLLNVSGCLKSTQVDMLLRSQVKSSRMCSSRPPSTWGHFSLKSGQVTVSSDSQVYLPTIDGGTPDKRCARHPSVRARSFEL